MRTLRRGVLAAALIATVVVGVASAVSAQGTPYDMLSFNGNPSPAMAAAGVPDTTVGYRFDSEAVAVVVPATLGVNDETLRTIDQVIWNTEPVRFRHLEVWQSDLTRVLHRQSYAELKRTFGERPSGLHQQSLREFGDSLDRAVYGPSAEFAWLQAIVSAAVVAVVAVVLVVVVLALTSAQWRRARADAEVVRRRRSAGAVR
jgi:hypothetical protein